MFDGPGQWCVCDSGYFFMDPRKPSMFMGQLRCREYGLVLTGYFSSKGRVIFDSDTVLPPQGVKLVDI